MEPVYHHGEFPKPQHAPSTAGATQPVRMERARQWTKEAENNFRLQESGWRDETEYAYIHGEPERWPESGLVKKLKVKKTGFFTYWRRERECPDNALHRIKLYRYQ